MGNSINPTATYHYVYYGATGGSSHVRQPRTAGLPAQQVFVDIPGVAQPNGNGCVTGDAFYLNGAPLEWYPGTNGPDTYEFGFINVTGLVEGGQLINAYTNATVGTVGTAPIDVWVVYYIPPVGGGSGGSDSGSVIDAYDVTTGTLINDTFVDVYGENTSNLLPETAEDNVDGYVDTTSEGKTITALDPSIPYSPSVVPSKFLQWEVFYGPNATNNNLTVEKGEDSSALALYQSPLIWNCPCPYVSGGIYSSDIKLTGPNGPVNPAVNTDASLTPNTQYTLGAMVHNDSANDAGSTVVTFWEIPGGNGSNATLLNTQTIPVYFIMNGSIVQIPNTNGAAIIPAGSSAYFESSVDFWSGLSPLFPDEHNCAGVSVYNPLSECCPQATDAAGFWGASGSEINSPTNAGQPSCSAWLNTNAITVNSGMGFRFGLGLGQLNPVYGRDTIQVQIQVQAQYIPVEWNNIKEVREIGGLFRSAGVTMNYPLYLLPSLQHTIRPIDLDIKVAINEVNSPVEREKWHFFNHEKGKSSSYEVSGVIPETAKKGDIFLVTVTAHYPAIDRVPAKSVNFLEFLHVS